MSASGWKITGRAFDVFDMGQRYTRSAIWSWEGQDIGQYGGPQRTIWRNKPFSNEGWNAGRIKYQQIVCYRWLQNIVTYSLWIKICASGWHLYFSWLPLFPYVLLLILEYGWIVGILVEFKDLSMWLQKLLLTRGLT
jgi:hypothetical protein